MSGVDVPFIDLKAQYAVARNEINDRIDKVLNHGQYIMGPEVKELELRLADFVGVRHCVTVSSGTEALLISLMAIGVGPGDEVITTPFSFVATAEVIVLLGATPVYVDIEPDTCNIDSTKIEEAISVRTKAILPVSLYGQPADMDEINQIAARHGLRVIEDAAQSFGAMHRGRYSCNLSAIGCTSFFPSKPLGCYGDGGAIFTDDDSISLACAELRVHGQSKRYVHTRVGVGGRMDTLQCAIVLAKLDLFHHEIKLRAEIAEEYFSLLDRSNFASIAGNRIPEIRDYNQSVFAQFTVQVSNRAALIEKLRSAGVPTAVHYPVPINEQPAYAGAGQHAGATPISSEVAKRVLSIPFGPYLQREHQELVVSALAR